VHRFGEVGNLVLLYALAQQQVIHHCLYSESNGDWEVVLSAPRPFTAVVGFWSTKYKPKLPKGATLGARSSMQPSTGPVLWR
jgi:hypothetical protein